MANLSDRLSELNRAVAVWIDLETENVGRPGLREEPLTKLERLVDGSFGPLAWYRQPGEHTSAATALLQHAVRLDDKVPSAVRRALVTMAAKLAVGHLSATYEKYASQISAQESATGRSTSTGYHREHQGLIPDIACDYVKRSTKILQEHRLAPADVQDFQEIFPIYLAECQDALTKLIMRLTTKNLGLATSPRNLVSEEQVQLRSSIESVVRRLLPEQVEQDSFAHS